MKCLHCLENFFETWQSSHVGNDGFFFFTASVAACAACNRNIIQLEWKRLHVPNARTESMMVYPKGFARSPLPKSVPEKFAEDYKEACAVLADSPKASAAMGCLCL